MIYEWSKTGSNHKLNETANQDCLRYDMSDDSIVISLADGVSECAEAGEGARIAAEAITRLLSLKGTILIDWEKEQVAKLAIAHIMYELEKKADNCGRPVSEYSSTVTSAMYDRINKKLLCFNIGDSVMIGVSGNRCRILAMPYDSSEGCCVTTSKGAESEAVVKVIDTNMMDSIILCSDGAWREMFSAGRIIPEVSQMLISGDYGSLEYYLTQKNTYDDCSFIAMDVSSRRPA